MRWMPRWERAYHGSPSAVTLPPPDDELARARRHARPGDYSPGGAEYKADLQLVLTRLDAIQAAAQEMLRAEGEYRAIHLTTKHGPERETKWHRLMDARRALDRLSS